MYLLIATFFFLKGVIGVMWDLVSYVQSGTRKACLLALLTGPKTPKAISISSGKHLSHISRALGELENKKLIVCLTPNNNKNRIFKITNLGKIIINKI